jgi:hypothetical protein
LAGPAGNPEIQLEHQGRTADRYAGRPRPHWLRIVGKLAIPAVILAAAWFVGVVVDQHWAELARLGLGFAFVVYLAVVARGRYRDAAAIVASVLLCLVALDAYHLMTSSWVIETRTPGYQVARAILGWGPEHPGVFNQTKRDGKTGRVIIDADYTIDAHLARKVISAEAGPTVAFFGDSWTFGHGLPDALTLPQLYADTTERRLRVLNLAFNGYGPQQLLRPLEVGMYDDLLKQLRVVVFQTSPSDAERSSCARDFMMRAPRYVLIDGQPSFQGTCAERSHSALRWLYSTTSFYYSFVEPLLSRANQADLDLYVGIIIRAGQLAREKYGAATAILFIPADASYMQHAGYTNEQIVQRLRDAGLLVIDGTLDPGKFAGQDLRIPGDGHPTGVANRARAAILADALADLVAQPR